MPETVHDSRSSIATDPLRNFRFRVYIHHHTPNGFKLGELGFMSMSGLNVETSVIAYRQGGFNTTQQKMPGQSEFTPITLTKGAMVNTPHSYEWMREIFSIVQGEGTFSIKSGKDFRANIGVAVLAHPHTASNKVPVLMRFRIYNAWPTSIGFSDLDAGGNAILMEQMVIQHEGWALTYAKDPYGRSEAPIPSF